MSNGRIEDDGPWISTDVCCAATHRDGNSSGSSKSSTTGGLPRGCMPGCGLSATWVDMRTGLSYCGPCAKLTPQDTGCPEPAEASGHLGGPDDAHYAQLAIQPIEVTEAWAPTWPVGIGYHLGEAVAAIARCGTKGQAARDLRKASWLLERAADVIEAGARHPNDKRGR